MKVAGWRNVRLEDLFENRKERGLPELPTISVTISDGLINRNQLERKTDTTLEPSEHLLVQPNDIVYNTMRMWQGASGLVTKSAIVSPAYVVVKPLPTVDSHFASYLFKTPRMIHLFWAYSHGLTDDRRRLYFDDFADIPAFVPPVEEQRRIAEILSTWDRAIAATEKLIANSQSQKKALMQQLLTGKKRLPGFSGEWKNDSFENIFRIANDKSTQVQAKNYLIKGNIPIVDQGQEKIAGYTSNTNFYRDTPAVVFGDHTRVVKWIDFPFCPGADGTQVLKSQPGVDLRFCYFLLSNAEIPNLGYSRHMKELKTMQFKVPIDIVEQINIAGIISSAEKLVSAAADELKRLNLEKSALMQQLLTGKRRVKLPALQEGEAA